MIQGVIFDMDGLMFDTEVIYFRAWQEAAAQYGYDISIDMHTIWLGLNHKRKRKEMKELFGQNFPLEAIDKEKYQWVKNYFEHNGVPLKAGLLELLNYLFKKGIRMAVASSSDRIDVMNYLEKAKIKHYFTKVVCGDMVRNGKPDPEIYLTALKELGLTPKYCIALEDAPNGVIAANKAGLKVIMIPDLITPDATITKILYKKADSLSDVISLIDLQVGN